MDGAADALLDCVRRALAEDLGRDDLALAGDLTSTLALPAATRGRARMIAKAGGVLAGLECAVAAFEMLDAGCSLERHRRDGAALEAGAEVLTVESDMRSLLAAERTALNFVQRLSGVATLTRRFVEAVAGTPARILDTRKTTPGLRALQKAAVVAGGGENHRAGLFDQVLLKENHFALAAPIAYEEVVRRCSEQQTMPVIAEARTVDEAVAAVRGGAGVVLLDNFRAGEPLRAAVAAVRAVARELGRAVETEASGGIELGTVRAFAECGVDRISVGALTHSAPAIDLSLLVEGVGRMKSELRFQPDQQSLRRVRGEVRAVAAGLGAAERVCDTAALVIDELGNNAIEHGAVYRALGHELGVRLYAVTAGFEIEFHDPEMPDADVRDLKKALGSATETPALDSERGRGLFLLSVYLGDLRIDRHSRGGLWLRGVIAGA